MSISCYLVPKYTDSLEGITRGNRDEELFIKNSLTKENLLNSTSNSITYTCKRRGKKIIYDIVINPCNKAKFIVEDKVILNSLLILKNKEKIVKLINFWFDYSDVTPQILKIRGEINV